MKITKLHKQSKPEDKNIHPFLEFYYKETRKDIFYEAIDEAIKGNTPDYYIDPMKVLVEVKEIHDTKDRSRSAQWGKIVDNLRKQIRINPKLTQVKGLYSLRTAPQFKFPTNKNQVKKAADRILDAVIKEKQNINFHNVNFNIKKVSDEGNGIYFSTQGLGGSFDPADTIHQNIRAKLNTANKQLSFTPDNKKVEKRILLLVNQYPLLHWDWDLFKAISYSYKQLLTYGNIDEIWFQNPNKDDTYSHTLLYTKQFLSGYHNQKLEVKKGNALLLANWFSALEKMGDEYKKKLFIVLKKFIAKKDPHKWFRNNSAREEMVRLGVWLIDNKRFNDAVWLIEKFIDDPDPEEPDNYTGDPDFNYHQQILEGKDPHIITTVLGHLTWTIQKLATRRKDENKKYTIKAFGYTKSLIKHKNYYVKLQAIIPLIEIARRRQWLTGWGKRPRKAQYREFHEAVFDLINLLEENPKCIAIAKWLCNVFSYYKDLSTEEANRVLDALRITDESAGLFLYYGIYRKDHYKDQNIKFNGKALEKKLEELIKSKAKRDQALKSNLAWHFWKLLKENPNEFDNLKEWIDLFVRQPYNKRIYGSMFRIIEEWIGKEAEICIDWLVVLVNKISKEIDTKEKARDFWLTTKTGKILRDVARLQPDKLTDLVKKMVYLWKLGVFIGSPKEIFESFKDVSDKNLKAKIRKEFQSLYKEMKKMNPKLEPVNW